MASRKHYFVNWFRHNTQRILVVIAAIAFFVFSTSAQAQTVATPTFSPAAGTSVVQFNLTVTDSTAGATIYYTLDGTTPTTGSSSVASGGTVLIAQSETVNAMAVASGYTNSAVVSATYEITGAVAAGWYHTITLKSDGTVWAWGVNTSGELGDGTTTKRTAIQQVTSLSGIVAISAGHYHTLALKSNGTVWGWGLNSNGQLGDNTTSERHSPVEVLKSNGSGGTTALTNIVAICSGAYHNLALDSSGNVWAWGLDSSGQLGDGGTTQQNMAEQLTTLSGVSVQQLAAGSYHSLLLTTGGTVEAWGLNATGQVGDGTTTQRNSPVAITGLSGVTIMALSGGEGHTLALENDGTVWGWGGSSYYALDGTGTQQNSPKHLSGWSGVAALSAGFYKSFAIKNDGSIWSWGYSQYGELGAGWLTLTQTPAQQMAGVSGAVAVTSGQVHAEVLKSDGTIYASGYNNDGQMGIGFSDANAIPVQVPTPDTYTAVASGMHDLLLKADGTVWAMGDNTGGDLGDGTIIQRTSPVQVSGLSGVTAVAANTISLALKSDGTVWGWGPNSFLQVGDGSYLERDTPVQAGATTTGFTNMTAISAGWYSSYSLKNDGTVWAWGDNRFGQLGNNSTTRSGNPVQVSGLTGITTICGGEDHALALKSDGTVWAWGGNSSGDLGDGTTTQHNTAEQVMLSDGVTPLGNIVSVYAGLSYCLAIDGDGYVWAWGANSAGELGDGTTTEEHHPEKLTGISGVVKFISLTSYFTEVLKSDGTVWGWGPNWNGELATGNTTVHFSPVQSTYYVGLHDTVRGTVSTVVLKEDGHLEGTGVDDYAVQGLCDYSIPFVLPGINTLAPAIPTVSITAPSNNATVVQGTTQTFTASASETGGTVASVSYYVNSTLIGTSTTGSSYSVNWTPTTYGYYIFTAITTDTSGHTSYRSSPITVQVPHDSDSNGLPDWWELKYGIFGHGYTSSSSFNGNGLSLGTDFAQGNDPTNYYSQGGHVITPVLSIVSGNNQLGIPGAFADSPLEVQITNSSGGASLTNAPLTFAVTSGGGLVATTPSSSLGATISLTTDSGGLAQVSYQLPTGNNANGTVNATSNGQSITFTETTTVGDGTYDAPTNVTATSPGPTEIDLNWVNHASTATSIVVQESTDNVTWSTVATLNDPTVTSYSVNSGLTVSVTYYFRVYAQK